MMATFRNAPCSWTNSGTVHIVSNSVWERSSKFARCGAKIGTDAQYDGELVPSCDKCINGAARDERAA